MCYEVFSFGKMPYHGRTNEEVMDEVPVGRRLQQPKLCPDAIFALMLQTWAHKDAARPEFAMLAECLLDIRDRLASGVDDPDLICSQATAVMRARGGAHQIYHDKGLEQLGEEFTERKRRLTEHMLTEGRQQRRRTRRRSPSCSSSRRASRRRRHAARKGAVGEAHDSAASDHVSDGEGLGSRQSSASRLSSFSRRASTVASSDAEGEYIMLGEAYSQAAGDSIVLEPEGLDATRLYEDSRPGRRQSHLNGRRTASLAQEAGRGPRNSGGLRGAYAAYHLRSPAEEGGAASGMEDECDPYDDPAEVSGIYEDHNLPEFMLREQPDTAMYITIEPSMQDKARAVKAKRSAQSKGQWTDEYAESGPEPGASM